MTATVPIICRKHDSCTLELKLVQDIEDVFLSHCLILMKNSDKPQSVTLEVNAKRDFIIDGIKTVKIKVKISESPDLADWIDHVKLHDITVSMPLRRFCFLDVKQWINVLCRIESVVIIAF